MSVQLHELLYGGREETGDVHFLIGPNKIHAHRCVLAASSTFYHRLFYSTKGVQSMECEVDSRVSLNVFNEYIRFFYLGKANFTEENIEPILKLATETHFDECVQRCDLILSATMDVKNVCWVFKLAIENALTELQLHCITTIHQRTAEVLASNAFLECDYQILRKILNLIFLSCGEIVLMRSCISWAKAECRRNNSEDDSPKNLRAILKDAVRLIRFASMSIEEFYDLNVQYNGFFEPEECVEITGIICGHRSYGNFIVDRRQKISEGEEENTSSENDTSSGEDTSSEDESTSDSSME